MASEIMPVEQAAREAADKIARLYGWNGASGTAHGIIQRAILVERERCAAVATSASDHAAKLDAVKPSDIRGACSLYAERISTAILKSPETPDDQ